MGNLSSNLEVPAKFTITLISSNILILSSSSFSPKLWRETSPGMTTTFLDMKESKFSPHWSRSTLNNCVNDQQYDDSSHALMYMNIHKAYICTSFWKRYVAKTVFSALTRRYNFCISGWVLSIFSTKTAHRLRRVPYQLLLSLFKRSILILREFRIGESYFRLINCN